MARIGIGKSQLTGGGGGSSAPNFGAILTGTAASGQTFTMGSGTILTTSGNGQVNSTQFQQIAVVGSNPINGQTFGYDISNFEWIHAFGVYQPIDPSTAAINRTTQTGNLAATTILAVPSSGLITAGFYSLEVRIIVSRADTAGSPGSTLPDTQLIFTDGDSNATITFPMTASSTGNTTSTVVQATYNFYAKGGTNVQITIGQVTPYASNGTGAAAMQYSYRARLTYKL